MSNIVTEVDTAPEAVDGEHVASPETTTDMNQEALAKLFANDHLDDATDEETITGDEEVEKPASEDVAKSETEEEEISLNEEVSEEETETKEPESKSEVPDWVQPRIDKLTAQRKAAEERSLELEARLKATESKEQPVNSVDQTTNVSQLDDLEKQAIEAEEQVEDLLETKPLYERDDYDNENPYWLVGDEKMTREQLINIKKNARKAYRAIPARRKFLELKAETDVKLEKVSFFSDPEHPYYEKTQAALSSPVFKMLEEKIPNAKATVYLMIRGMQADDAEMAKSSKKVPSNPAPIIKSTPASKAATDTATSPQPSNNTDAERKRNRRILNSGNVSSSDAALLFR